eukprot:scaffold318240_cov15-Prasinocladus_malaysianus.AAC.1
MRGAIWLAALGKVCFRPSRRASATHAGYDITARLFAHGSVKTRLSLQSCIFKVAANLMNNMMNQYAL